RECSAAVRRRVKTSTRGRWRSGTGREVSSSAKPMLLGPSQNPIADRGLLRVGELGVLGRWHLAGRDELPNAAAVQIAGSNAGSAFTAAFGRGERPQIQFRFLRQPAVARNAFRSENRQNVLVKR